MFASRFQGGSHVEVFTPQGSQPLQTWRLTQGKKIGRIFDKSVKGNIIVIDGGNATRASLPKDEKSSLGLRQPFVIFQVYCPVGTNWTFELWATDTRRSRKRLHFSTNFREIVSTPLHVQIPLVKLRRGTWLNLCIDLEDLIRQSFGTGFATLDSLVIYPLCRLRRIFTVPAAPVDTTDDGSSQYAAGGEIPRSQDFPLGVNSMTQCLRFSTLQETVSSEIGGRSCYSDESLQSDMEVNRRQLSDKRRTKQLSIEEPRSESEARRPLTHNPGVAARHIFQSIESRKGATTAPHTISSSSPREHRTRLKTSSSGSKGDQVAAILLPKYSQLSPSGSPTKLRRDSAANRSHEDTEAHSVADSVYDIPSVLEHRKKNNSVVQVSSNAVREIILNSGHSRLHSDGATFQPKQMGNEEDAHIPKEGDMVVMSALDLDEYDSQGLGFSPQRTYDFRNYIEDESTCSSGREDSPDNRLRGKKCIEHLHRDITTTMALNQRETVRRAESEDGVVLRPTTAETDATTDLDKHMKGDYEGSSAQDPSAVASYSWTRGNFERNAPIGASSASVAANEASRICIASPNVALRYPKDLFSPAKEERAFTPPLVLPRQRGSGVLDSPARPRLPGSSENSTSPRSPSQMRGSLADKASAHSQLQAPISVSSAGTETLIIDSETVGSGLPETQEEVALELVFDPILQCYYDPATNKYYELR